MSVRLNLLVLNFNQYTGALGPFISTWCKCSRMNFLADKYQNVIALIKNEEKREWGYASVDETPPDLQMFIDGAVN